MSRLNNPQPLTLCCAAWPCVLPVFSLAHQSVAQGVARSVAVWHLGNSRTGLNYRARTIRTARDCLGAQTVRRLQRPIAQAARRATKYFTGYLQKPQPLNRAAARGETVELLGHQAMRGQGAAAIQASSQRVLGDLEFRCSVRPLTEEFMLAGFWDASEPSAAECVRSFCVAPFVGHEWLTQLDAVPNSGRNSSHTAKATQSSSCPTRVLLVRVCETVGSEEAAAAFCGGQRGRARPE